MSDATSYYTPERNLTPMGMVQEFSKTLDQKPDPDLYIQLIFEEFDEFGMTNRRTVDELKELADLVYVIYGYANSLDYDLDEALLRVHNNNLGRCIWPDGSIKRRPDGKILKNPAHPEVELGDLVK